MRQHEYTVELPHAPARRWALFQRYDLWKEVAPAVLDVLPLHQRGERGVDAGRVRLARSPPDVRPDLVER